MKTVLLIDFENIQDIALDSIDTASTEVRIFVGRSQNRVPFEIVTAAQKLGKALTWIKIAGDGKNNLDFHIAFELGRLTSLADRNSEFVVLSKDTGYDSVLDYARSTGIKCRRIKNLAELSNVARKLPSSPFAAEVLSNLQKIDPKKRPRTRESLRKHLESAFKGKIGREEIQTAIEVLFLEGKLAEENRRLKYSLESAGR